MQIRRLELRGIGPFSGTHTIDFDSLTRGGIFLMEGPTGSGKSTIIDAITWALFAGVAGGSDSSDERIRSTHADPKLESYVDLIFSVDAGTFRVRRTPKWTKTGNKNPTNASAKLWKLDDGAYESGAWETQCQLIERKLDAAGGEIPRLLGISREQFLQTVVLPQGKFAEFLRLKTLKRAELLETIFDTSIYRKIADELKNRSAQADAQVSEARRAWETAVSQAAKILGDDSIDSSSALHSDQAAEVHEAIDQALQLARESAGKASRDAREQEDLARHAQEALQEAQDLEKRLHKRADLLRLQALLDTKDGTISSLREELRLDAQAREVHPYAERAQAADSALELARTRTRSLRVEEGADLSQEEAELSRLVALSASLAPLLDREGKLGSLASEISSLQRNKENAEKEHSSYAQELEEIEPQLSSLAQVVENSRGYVRKEEQLHSEEKNVKEQLAQSQILANAQVDLESAERDARDKSTQAEKAQKHADAVRLSWVSSISSILAMDLSDGLPCPVCGSHEHPAPAATEAIAATQEDSERASAAAQAAASVRNAALATLATRKARMDGLLQTLAGKTQESLEARALQIHKELEACQKALKEGESAQERIEQLNSRQSFLSISVAKHAMDIARLEEEIRGKERQIVEIESEIAPHLGGHSSLSARAEEVRTSESAQRAKVNALRDLGSAEAQAESRQSDLRDALAAHDFDGISAYKAALIEEADRFAKAREVEEYDAARAQVTHGLASPEISELTGAEEPHTSLLAEESEQARTRAAAAQQAQALAVDLVRRGQDALDECNEELASWKQASEDAGPIVRLAHLAAAEKESLTRVPLATYVVQQRFEQILEHANEQLANISLGRYQLRRIDEKEANSREQKTGLGLAVVDRDGDSEGAALRPPRSLSGGETFYVSLALALALADVVRNENGGVQLDTLLIDEGFGSLDEDTLDRVMDTLTSLSSAGRAVGIVSHVSEMKSRIAEQVNVRRKEDGSSDLSVRS